MEAIDLYQIHWPDPDRDLEEAWTTLAALSFSTDKGIGVIVYSPMKSGLLSGAMTRERIANLPDDDFRRSAPQFNEPLLSRNLKLVDMLRSLGRRHGGSPGEVAIAWALSNQHVTGAIVGVRSAQQVEGILGAAEFQLSQQELSDLDQFLRDTDTWKLRVLALARRASTLIR